MFWTSIRTASFGALGCLMALSCKPAAESRLQEAVTGEESTLPDETVEQALNALGAKYSGLEGASRCAGQCHVPDWHKLTKFEVAEKWVKLGQATIDCLKSAPDDAARFPCLKAADGSYKTKQLGVFRGGAHTSYFQNIFKAQFPDEEAFKTEYEGWLAKARMPGPHTNPNGSTPMSEEEFKAVRTVYEHPDGAQRMASFFSTVEDNSTCQTEISPAMIGYLKSRDSRHGGTSWFDVNMEKVQQRKMAMFGCRYTSELNPYTDPVTKCFQSGDPEANWNDAYNIQWAKGWTRVRDEAGDYVEQNIRVLSELHNARTTYWMRSSADGRFIGNGLTGVPSGEESSCERQSGSIFDLKKGKHIYVDAPYDPGFSADNEVFTFIAGQAHFCSQKVLYRSDLGQCFEMRDNPACTNGKLGVYQHVGSTLDGSSYVVVRSSDYANDDGANSVHADPPADAFGSEVTTAEFYVFCEAGDNCRDKLNDLSGSAAGAADFSSGPFGITKKIEINFSYEGDFGISASAGVISSRVASKDGRHIGYRIFDYDLKNKTQKRLANICMKGGKASFSFNERFLVTHHYTDATDWRELNKGLPQSERFEGPEDPRFKKYVGNSSNIMIADLATGKVQRLTFTSPGQYALYPHFRADGWIYFLMRERDGNKDRDVVVATDAAIRMAIQNPLPN